MMLIVGNGVIGKLLSMHWKKAEIMHHVSTRHRHQMQDHLPFINLSSKAKFSFQEEYSTAILCAGNSNVLECRNDPIGTRMINLDGTINLARYLETQGAQIIFISSDKVFSGENGNRDPVPYVTPTGIIVRLLSKDLLNQKLNKSKKSYWIKRKKSISSMENQF